MGKLEIFLFSDDDAAIVEAVVQAAVPHIEILRAREDLNEALNREKDAREQMYTSLRVLGHETKQLNFGLARMREDYLADVRRLKQLSEHRANIVCRDIEGYFKQLDFLFTQARMIVIELPKPAKEEFWAYTELIFKWEYIYRLEAEHKNLEFDIHHPWVSDPERPRLCGDKVQLEQLVYNLVSNAVKHCYEGTKIRIECKKPDTRKKTPHILSVTNYGREFQCDNPYQLSSRGVNVDGIEGIGIGLYNAKRVADAHKGLFEYKCDKASQFNVPIIEPYLKLNSERRDMSLLKPLQQELNRLKESKKYDDIVAHNKFGLRLYQPEIEELIDLVNKPTWRVTFEVTIPAKGS